MDYWKKVDENPYTDYYWNIPEQPQGMLNIIGGNSKSFNTESRLAEKLSTSFPIKDLRIVLPDSLKKELPPLPNLVFLSSTDTGSFKEGEEIAIEINKADYNILLGDFSKNSITEKAVSTACITAEVPAIIARDAVDLIYTDGTKILMNENIILFASVAQLKKLFQSIYYPKVILLTMSTMQLVEALHKFTLSYPANIITFHNGQILVAKNGGVHSIPLEKTGYSPLTFWSGQIIGNIAAMNLFVPNNFIPATIAGIFKN